MDIREIGVIDLSSRRIGYLAEQQRVTARNIANADTPGYRALEMRPFKDFLVGSTTANPVRTNERHMTGVGRGNLPDAVPDRTSPMSPNGNNVLLDEQMVTASEAQAGHAFASSIYKKASSLLMMSVK